MRTKYDSNVKTFVGNQIDAIRHLRHPNLAILHGASIIGENVLIISELSEIGTLHNVKVLITYQMNLLLSFFAQLLKTKPITISKQLVDRFMLDIVTGMKYLHDYNIVHGDLSSSNILVFRDMSKSDYRLKISDVVVSKLKTISALGNTVDTGDENYKLLAPEYLGNGMLSTATDVFSFAMVSFELISGGSRPFESEGMMHQYQYNTAISNLQRPFPPARSPPLHDEQTWNIIIECWNENPSLRPSFAALWSRLVPLHSSNLTGSGSTYAASSHVSGANFEQQRETFITPSVAIVPALTPITADDNLYRHDPKHHLFPQLPPVTVNAVQAIPKSPETEAFAVSDKPREKKISPRIWIIIAIVGVLIIAGAVAGTVYALNQNKSGSSSTSTPNNQGSSSTSSAPGASPTKGLHQFVASMSEDHTVRIWDINSNSNSAAMVFNSPTNNPFHNALVVNGTNGPRLFAAGRNDNNIYEWNFVSGSTPIRTYTGHTAAVNAMKVSSDNPQRMISVSNDKNIFEWDISESSGNTVRPIRTFNGVNENYDLVILSGSPPRMFTACLDLNVHEYDISQGTANLSPTRLLQGHRSEVDNVKLVDSRLFSGGGDGNIIEWDIGVGKAGTVLRNITTGYVTHVALATLPAQGSSTARLFSASVNGYVFEWPIDTTLNRPTAIRTFKHTSSVVVYGLVAVPGNLPRLFSADNNDVKEWDIQGSNTSPLRTFSGHTNSINALLYFEAVV
ncbi:hypothetical protein HK098_005914 [Nowakowskiella sp. JEL0407]|nr:hypothetical protein HK098_005914 [Nowakowskiella sp. JEL0407]